MCSERRPPIQHLTVPSGNAGVLGLWTECALIDRAVYRRCRPGRAKRGPVVRGRHRVRADFRSGEGVCFPKPRRKSARTSDMPSSHCGRSWARRVFVESSTDRRAYRGTTSLSPLRESCRLQEPPTGITSANATLRLAALDELDQVAVGGGVSQPPLVPLGAKEGQPLADGLGRVAGTEPGAQRPLGPFRTGPSTSPTLE